MNKVSVFCLLVSLFAFGSCHEDEVTEFENKVYTNFPDVFDVPAEGGKFLIKQTYNNDYFLTYGAQNEAYKCPLVENVVNDLCFS